MTHRILEKDASLEHRKIKTLNHFFFIEPSKQQHNSNNNEILINPYMQIDFLTVIDFQMNRRVLRGPSSRAKWLPWEVLSDRQEWMFMGSPCGPVVKVVDFSIPLNHLIISPLWLVWVRSPQGSHVGQVKFCLRVCQVVSHSTPVLSYLLIGSSLTQTTEWG